MVWPFDKKYLDAEEEEAVVDAINRAQEGNLGEVRVHIEKRCDHGDGALGRAREKFYKLGMSETDEGTGVLLYVALKDRVTAVYAGPGIHTCCAEAFWEDVTETVARGYKEGRGAEGIVEAVDKIGDLLREHVPGEKDENELPEEVTMA